MPLASVLVTDVRSRVVESVARFFSDAEILRWINFGYHDFVSRTEFLQRVTSFTIQALQHEYDLPTSLIKIENVTYKARYRLLQKNLDEFRALIRLNPNQKSDRPFFYVNYPWNKRVWLFPIPSTASATTTLSGAIDAVVTTIPVTAATAVNLLSRGRVQIDTEQIEYQGIDAASNNLLFCKRGDGGSAAASHLISTTVTQMDLEVYHSYDPSDLTTTPDTTPDITNVYHEALVFYATYVAFGKRDKLPEAKMAWDQYMRLVEQAKAERRIEQADRAFPIQDEEMLGLYGVTPWP